MDQDWNNFWCFEAQEAREGIIVSNDNLHDFINENEAFKDAIENRLLNFNFVLDKDGIFDPRGPRFLVCWSSRS